MNRKLTMVIICLVTISLFVIAGLKMYEGFTGNSTGVTDVAKGKDKKKDKDKEKAQPTVDINQIRKDVLSQADVLYSGYFYNEAIELINQTPNIKNTETDEFITKCDTAVKGLVEYTGEVHHVFFHSLAVYPELTFDGDYKAEGYNMWMTTSDEFSKMLPLLQKNNFILVDIKDMYTLENDVVKEKKLILPKGKKALIISIDDVNYYEYMKGDGFANRLVINDKGDVVTEVITPKGETIQTYDGDVMPILDEYVKEHPEFSYRGAKGIMAVTGYEGALGYRISDLKGQELTDALTELNAVVNRLKETGWHFASHSYTHNNWFGDLTISMKELKSDVKRWKQFIVPGVAETELYIAPFGTLLSGDRFDYIVKEGFNIYFPVGKGGGTTYTKNSMIQYRYNLDGYHMYDDAEYINKTFFNVKKVLDKKRPKKTW